MKQTFSFLGEVQIRYGKCDESCSFARGLHGLLSSNHELISFWQPELALESSYLHTWQSRCCTLICLSIWEGPDVLLGSGPWASYIKAFFWAETWSDSSNIRHAAPWVAGPLPSSLARRAYKTLTSLECSESAASQARDFSFFFGKLCCHILTLKIRVQKWNKVKCESTLTAGVRWTGWDVSVPLWDTQYSELAGVHS